MAAAPPLLLFGALLLPLLVCSASRPPAAEASAAPAPTGEVEVKVGVLLPKRDLRLPWAWPRVAPALRLAVEELQPQLRQAGLEVRPIFASTENDDGACDENVAEVRAGELKVKHDPDVLLGLGCFDSTYSLAPFARYWRLPLLRAGLSKIYSASSQLVFAGPAGAEDFGAFQAQLFQLFNWTARAALVVSRERESLEYTAFLMVFQERLEADSPDFVHRRGYQEPGEAVHFIQNNGRVVYIFGSLEMLQQIMHSAHAQNMTNGDYIFFYVDIFRQSLRAEGHREAAKPWQSNETQNTGGLREAFQTVLVITSHEPQTPEYRRFQSQLILRAQRDFGVTLNDSLGHLVAGCFHDGLLLYLRALNETLREGGTKRDTSRILEHMRGQTFQGVTGMVSINSNNQREMDFDLWAMGDVESGEFQVFGHYIASERQINWTRQILWKAGRPPLDNPPCVFDMDDPFCDPPSLLTSWQPVLKAKRAKLISPTR